VPPFHNDLAATNAACAERTMSVLAGRQSTFRKFLAVAVGPSEVRPIDDACARSERAAWTHFSVVLCWCGVVCVCVCVTDPFGTVPRADVCDICRVSHARAATSLHCYMLSVTSACQVCVFARSLAAVLLCAPRVLCGRLKRGRESLAPALGIAARVCSGRASPSLRDRLKR